MELQKNRIEYKYDSKELQQEMKEFVSDIRKLIEEKDFNLSREAAEALDYYQAMKWRPYFGNMSKNMMKKFNKYLIGYKLKRNQHKANLLLHFIHTRVLAERREEKWYDLIYVKLNTPEHWNKVVIKKSLKEQTIQRKRKEWVEAREKAIAALNAYKLEKGNFYK